MKFIQSILILVGILLAAQPKVTQLFSVQKVSVQKESLSQEFTTYGYVRANQENIYAVTPRFGGYVEKIFVDKIYAKVKKGEPLVSVYSPEVYKAKENYLNSYLYAQRNGSKGMLESARKNLELLGVDSKEIQAVLKDKTVSLYTTIYAPSNGYVFIKNIVAGAAFNQKQILYEIVNLDTVWVEAKLFDNQIAKVQKAKSFTIKNEEQSLQTTTKFLYPKLEPKEATYTLRLEVVNKDHVLLEGMYVTVMANTQEKEYLTLPKTAVIQKNGKHYVFLATEFEGEYEPLEVKVQTLSHEKYAIVKGLNEKDEVLNNALFMIDSDTQINGLY